MLADILRRKVVRPAARPVRHRPAVRIAAETLEERVVLSAAAAAPALAGEALGTIEDITVNSVQVVEGQLVANATVVGELLGRTFEQDVQIPIDVGTTENGVCDILNLSLGPVHLDVLGLQVDLDDCDDGPITVDITAEEGSGNLLGNLLCDVANLLNGDGVGDGTLDDLTDEQLAAIAEALNLVFDEALNTTAVTAAAQLGVGGSTTDLLDLEIPGGVHLDLLGLNIDTSGICLHVSAESGSGNLLGNLLGSIAHLLDRDPGNAINAKLDQFEKVLARAADDLLA